MAESASYRAEMVTAQSLLGMEFTTVRKLVLVYFWEVTMAREHHIGLTQA